jgi:hypothetical protein
MAASAPTHREHPLTNLLVNVLVPVLALSHLSKDPETQRALGEAVRPWHIGPVNALFAALVLPAAYGILHFIRSRRMNLFSVLGLASVLLTGGLTLFLWNADGSIKPRAALLFGLKEASIPLVLAAAVVASHFTASPLLRALVYSDSLFDIPRIENAVKSREAQPAYRRLLLHASLLVAASFIISAAANLMLSLHFLGHIDPTAANARTIFNEQVAKLTSWGYALIGLPMLAFLTATLMMLLSRLRKLTGLARAEILHGH